MAKQNTLRHPLFSRGMALLLAAYLGLAGGCEGDLQQPCYRVRGRVLRDQKPVSEAMVVFHRRDQQLSATPKPMAHTDAEGRFELTTFTPGDGAPVGDYLITVELRAPRQVGEEMVRDGPNTLPGRYARFETTPLAHEVTQGDNEVPPLVVEGR